MDDFYYSGDKKIFLPREPGCFTVGVSDLVSLDELMEYFSHTGCKATKISSDNRFLVAGPDYLSAEVLRRGLLFSDVPFITPVYQTEDAVLLLEDEIRVSGMDLKPLELKQFLLQYDLSLQRERHGEYQFKVKEADDNKTLVVARVIYESRNVSSTPIFKRILAGMGKIPRLSEFLGF